MKTQAEINTALNAIRTALDVNVVDAIIEDVQNKCISLTQLFGLSSETIASAKYMLYEKEVEVYVTKDLDKFAPQKCMKLLKSYCSKETATLEYADRLNAGLVHTIDALRSIISYRKSEMQNSLK